MITLVRAATLDTCEGCISYCSPREWRPLEACRAEPTWLYVAALALVQRGVMKTGLGPRRWGGQEGAGPRDVYFRGGIGRLDAGRSDSTGAWERGGAGGLRSGIQQGPGEQQVTVVRGQEMPSKSRRSHRGVVQWVETTLVSVGRKRPAQDLTGPGISEAALQLPECSLQTHRGQGTAQPLH